MAQQTGEQANQNQHQQQPGGQPQVGAGAKKKPAAGPGSLALQALLRGGSPQPAAVAKLVGEHPNEKPAMMELVHAQLGNGFAAQVVAAQSKEAPKEAPKATGQVATEAGATPGHAATAEHKPHLDVNSLGEEQIRDIVFFRAGTAGKFEGKERYEGKTPRIPKPGEATEDKDYDYETWEHAKHRLEVISIQSEGGEESENNVKNTTLFSASSTTASRHERREADERVESAKAKVEQIAETKGHAGRGAAGRAEAAAEKNQKGVYDKTKDPVAEEKEKAEKAKEANEKKEVDEKKEAVDKIKESELHLAKALAALKEPAPTGPNASVEAAHRKAEADKAQAELKAALDHAEKVGANKTVIQKAYDTLASHTEVSGDLVNKAATTGDKEVWGESHDGLAGPLGSKREGETHVLSARADAKAKVSVGKDGVAAEASVGAKAVVAEVRESFSWEMPGHFMGEAVNSKLFFQVSGMLGAEAHAKLKANLGAVNPKEPKLDMNQVSAGVDGFAGLKAKIGVGAAFEWQKQGAEAYKAKTMNAGKVLVDLLSVMNPPLGYILRQMDADTAAGKLMQMLMQWGKAGTVPLASIEAAVEGSAGIGGVAQASIGMKDGKFDFTTAANATFGVGLGGSVKVSLDCVEGPKFALITMGELRPIAIKFAEDKVKEGIASGSAFVGGIAQSISNWWHTKDRAHEGVKARVFEVLPADKNIELINGLFGWYCAEADQNAILEVLGGMSKHGQIGAISADFKKTIIGHMDAAAHRKAAGILGITPWK